jgi:hypothetical protein
VEAVLAFFAPDAIVRHRGATIPEGFWARATTLSGAQGRTGGWDHGLAWVRGAAGISDLAERAFRAHAHADTDTYQATGETVTWRYRLSEDPFQQLPRVWPVEGAAEAVVRGGQIVLLSTVHDANSVQRRQLALAAAQGADTAQATPRLQPRQTQDGTEPTTAAWPLALGGLAVLGCLVAVLRGRARV